MATPAATFHWTNASGGDWTDAGSWASNAVPQSADHAIIDAAGAYAVTTNADETVATLAIGADAALNIGAGTTFTIAHSTGLDANSGAISVGDGSTLAFGGTLANLGSITLGSTDQGTVTGDGSALLDNFGSVLGAGQLGSGEIGLTNEAGGLIDATDASLALVINTGAYQFINAGLVESTSPGGLEILDSNVTNTGTIEATNNPGLTIENHGDQQ